MSFERYLSQKSESIAGNATFSFTNRLKQRILIRSVGIYYDMNSTVADRYFYDRAYDEYQDIFHNATHATPITADAIGYAMMSPDLQVTCSGKSYGWFTLPTPRYLSLGDSFIIGLVNGVAGDYFDVSFVYQVVNQ